MSLKMLSAGFGLLVALAPMPAEAQRVSADIYVGTGPIRGHVRVGERPRYYRARHVVVQPRYRSERVIVIERRPQRLHVQRWRHHRHGSRVCVASRHDTVIVFYDARKDRFYDDYRPGLREVAVYEHEGGLYRDWDRDDYRRYHEDDRRYDRRWSDDDDDYDWDD